MFTNSFQQKLFPSAMVSTELAPPSPNSPQAVQKALFSGSQKTNHAGSANKKLHVYATEHISHMYMDINIYIYLYIYIYSFFIVLVIYSNNSMNIKFNTPHQKSHHHLGCAQKKYDGTAEATGWIQVATSLAAANISGAREMEWRAPRWQGMRKSTATFYSQQSV